MQKKDLLIIELNEFSEELLQKASKELNLKNIQRLLSLESSETLSINKKEHHGLDPWVQWVSVHTGVPNNIHQINHLAETRNLKNPQIWDLLGKEGYSSGLWGLMNSSNNNTENCRFFFPDPWCFNEKAYPNKINNFLALPRYYAKNYMSLSIKKIVWKSIKLFKFLLIDINIFYLKKEILYSIISFIKLGILNPSEAFQNNKSETYQNILFSLFDLFSAKIFWKYKNKYKPNLSIIFLNSLAHAQHKAWTKDYLSKNIIFTLKTIDKIFGILFKNINNNDNSILILNGLSQKNVDGSDYYIYRQINPEKFLRNLGLKFRYLEQCMTNESHIFFSDQDELNKAFNLLKEIKIRGENLFHVEKDKHDQIKLFYQIDFFKFLDKKEMFIVGEKEFSFYKYFAILNRRTGAHSPMGKAFFHNIKIRNSIYNHEIFEEILLFFKR